MKKLFFVMVLCIPIGSYASLRVGLSAEKRDIKIPNQFLTSGQTKTFEWGCPINNELVKATNKNSAQAKLIGECVEQVKNAAMEKPGVKAIVQTSVISPDLSFSETNQQFIYLVNGTVFLATTVSFENP